MMYSLAIASAITLAALQNAAANSARSELTSCIREAAAQAKKDKMATEVLTARMRQACDATAGRLKTALVAFDVKNGVSRKQAGADADLQLDDLYLAQEERYAYEMEKLSPKPAQAVAAKAVDPNTAK